MMKVSSLGAIHHINKPSNRFKGIQMSIIDGLPQTFYDSEAKLEKPQINFKLDASNGHNPQLAPNVIKYGKDEIVSSAINDASDEIHSLLYQNLKPEIVKRPGVKTVGVFQLRYALKEKKYPTDLELGTLAPNLKEQVVTILKRAFSKVVAQNPDSKISEILTNAIIPNLDKSNIFLNGGPESPAFMRMAFYQGPAPVEPKRLMD